MPGTRPRQPRPPDTHVIVDRRTWSVVSHHPSLAAARDAWRRKAFPTKGMVKGTLRPWASHHLIRTVAAAANRSAIEAAKRSRV
ncbi:hypothetical protein SAMN02799642_00835 [Methylobacterium brachiatum]|nr:hypothetical protein SAMN02799642_00835 [Methylobacterium brachiatum]